MNCSCYRSFYYTSSLFSFVRVPEFTLLVGF